MTAPVSADRTAGAVAIATITNASKSTQTAPTLRRTHCSAKMSRIATTMLQASMTTARPTVVGAATVEAGPEGEAEVAATGIPTTKGTQPPGNTANEAAN